MKNKNRLEDLITLVRTLRGPNGCPWDREQKASEVKSYLTSELYELLDAIDLDNPIKIQEELGDLLFLIIFLVDIFCDQGDFDIYEVIGTVMDKMVRRHPHVFGNEKVNNSDEVKANWRKIKKEEGKSVAEESILDGVPEFLPALVQTQLLTQKASRIGFDWHSPKQVITKIEEEIAELKQCIEGLHNNALENELGDLIFTLVNLGRFMGIDAEKALRKTNRKFFNRFRYIEQSLHHAGRDITRASLEEMDQLWEEAKAKET